MYCHCLIRPATGFLLGPKSQESSCILCLKNNNKIITNTNKTSNLNPYSNILQEKKCLGAEQLQVQSRPIINQEECTSESAPNIKDLTWLLLIKTFTKNRSMFQFYLQGSGYIFNTKNSKSVQGLFGTNFLFSRACFTGAILFLCENYQVSQQYQKRA